MLKLFKSIAKDLLIDSISSINIDIMNFLSIDCSTNLFSLFIKTKNKTFNKILQSDKSNIDLLMKNILDFLNENNLSFADISSIFVNQGPGNFSGLRGSLSIAKGICISKNLALFGYNTFLWSCAEFLNKEKNICSIIRLREKYFLKIFDNSLNTVFKAKEITKDEIIENYSKKFKGIPSNIKKNFDDQILKLNNLSVVKLDHNRLESLQLRGLLDKDLIKPLYLS